MVGGVVVEVVDCGDKVWINCRDRTYPKDFCAIYVEASPEARCVAPGDSVWWQGRSAMWTAKGRDGKAIGKPDTVLRRIGYSGVPYPVEHALGVTVKDEQSERGEG